MSTSYDGELKVWIVGVRDKNRNGSIWGELWKPTSMQWFLTRNACWKYIRTEVNKNKFDWLEYKPLRYIQQGTER